MIARRFYIPPAEFGTEIRLGKDESRHLSKVLRLGPGDEVRVFDGVGRECIYGVEQSDGRGVLIRFFREAMPTAPESPLSLTLAVPLLKQSNTELVLRKAVELGITHFVPLLCKRGEIAPEKWNPERSHRIAVEAAKQCGRATIPSIARPDGFENFVNSSVGIGILFHEDKGESLPGHIDSVEIVAVTGPEGGWEDSEVELAASRGFSIVHFGGRILRAETAAIAATAILQHRFGDIN